VYTDVNYAHSINKIACDVNWKHRHTTLAEAFQTGGPIAMHAHLGRSHYSCEVNLGRSQQFSQDPAKMAGKLSTPVGRHLPFM